MPLILNFKSFELFQTYDLTYKAHNHNRFDHCFINLYLGSYEDYSESLYDCIYSSFYSKRNDSNLQN